MFAGVRPTPPIGMGEVIDRLACDVTQRVAVTGDLLGRAERGRAREIAVAFGMAADVDQRRRRELRKLLGREWRADIALGCDSRVSRPVQYPGDGFTPLSAGQSGDEGPDFDECRLPEILRLPVVRVPGGGAALGSDSGPLPELPPLEHAPRSRQTTTTATG